MNKSIIFLVLFFFAPFLIADITVPQEIRIEVECRCTIKNVNKYPDYVFLAYPIILLNDTSIIKHQILKENQSIIPSVSNLVDIYAIKKSAYSKKKFAKHIKNRGLGALREVDAIKIGSVLSSVDTATGAFDRIDNIFQISLSQNKEKKQIFELIYNKTVGTIGDIKEVIAYGTEDHSIEKQISAKNKKAVKKTPLVNAKAVKKTPLVNAKSAKVRSDSKKMTFSTAFFYFGIPAIAFAVIVLLIARKKKFAK